MLNLQGFMLLKPSLYDLIGIVTRSAWQGYKPQIRIAPRDVPNAYNFRSELLTCM